MGLRLLKRQPFGNGPPLMAVPIEPLDLVFLGGENVGGHDSNSPACGIGQRESQDMAARVPMNLDAVRVDAIL